MKRAVQPGKKGRSARQKEPFSQATKAFSSVTLHTVRFVVACGRHRPIAGPKSMQAWIGEAAGVAGVEQVFWAKTLECHDFLSGNF
jgi:hypothetical protein